jgi:hypothetical protein
MAEIKTATVLIEGIKRRASIPENQATFESRDFLAFADEELLLGIVPAIMSVHEDYFLFEIEVPLQSGKKEYEIPSRAAGNKLRDLQYKPDPRSYVEMTRTGIGERFGDNLSNDIKKYYVKNNRVVVSDALASSTAGTLNFVFYIKPSQLVLEERIGIIQGINNLNNGTTQIVINAVPSNFNTSIKYDVYKSDSPRTILEIDMIPLTINTISRSVTFNTADIPNDLKVGDHLAQAGESTVAQIPNEFDAMLEQMVACRVLEAQGDTQGLQNALLKLKQMENAGGMLIDNRIDDAPVKIINRFSTLRSSVSRKFYRR